MPDVSFQPAIDALRLGFFVVPIAKFFLWGLKKMMYNVRI